MDENRTPYVLSWTWIAMLAVGTLIVTSADDQRRYDGYAGDCMTALGKAAEAARADGWVL